MNAYGRIIRRGGTTSGIPQFTFKKADGITDALRTVLDDGEGNWRIKFLESGTFTPERTITFDLFIVGAGGGGASGYHGGGGGGYTGTWLSIVFQAGISYAIVIGAGGGINGTGGTTSAFSYSRTGGIGAPENDHGGNGSCGGGGYYSVVGYLGGSNGANGGSPYGGIGQGTTTREFGEASGELYASGGSGAGLNSAAEGGGGKTNQAGAPNTGGGGGWQASGGSGVVVIRNHRAA